MTSALSPALGTRSLRADRLSTLTEVRPKGAFSAVGNVQQPEWIEIEITIDSGACETVMPFGMCSSISVLASRQYSEGVEYEVANGETIPNLGERRCLMMTQGSGIMKKINFQVAEVHKPLLSITRVADMGYDCVLGKGGGYLIDQSSGERIPLYRKDNLYILKARIKQDPSDVTPFGGPA